MLHLISSSCAGAFYSALELYVLYLQVRVLFPPWCYSLVQLWHCTENDAKQSRRKFEMALTATWKATRLRMRLTLRAAAWITHTRFTRKTMLFIRRRQTMIVAVMKIYTLQLNQKCEILSTLCEGSSALDRCVHCELGSLALDQCMLREGSSNTWTICILSQGSWFSGN